LLRCDLVDRGAAEFETVQDSSTSIPPVDLWLSRFAKLVVVVAFWLIFVGGHTTTTGAGMAFPDWPLSHGSINPHGWWEDLLMRLEHGHRLTAGVFGLLVGALCAWIWRSKWSVPVSLVGAVVIATLARTAGLSKPMVGLVGIVASTVIFAIMLVRDSKRDATALPASVRWLAFYSFLGVVAQAILGGLRVVLDPGGIAATNSTIATTFRVLHGCFAQLELGLVVALTAMLSAQWVARRPSGKPLRLAWIVVGLLFLQLIVGASMRHMGAGLAIPTFPHASPSGSWLPAVHNTFVDLNFTHTRVGPSILAILVFILAVRAFRRHGEDSFIARPAMGLLLLTLAQIAMGVAVIWQSRPPLLTTFHVVNGAAILASAVLLAVRLGRASLVSNPTLSNPSPTLLRTLA
jgi:cytochrome c oxidase assembly protein subunit 15